MKKLLTKENLEKIKVIAIYGDIGTGKCLGKGTEIIMYDGSLKKVEDIKTGDKLMGIDNKPRKITSICKGKEQMYLIKQNKGIDYRVNESHILSLKPTNSTKDRWKKKFGEFVNISIYDFLKLSKTTKNILKGYKTSIDFKDKKVNINPYYLGLWLGDGSSSKPQIYNKDKEIINFIKRYGRKIGLTITIENGKCKGYSLVNKRGSRFNMKKLLRSYNLINNKHIPKDYLYNSKKKRLELLAGILDSDGYYDFKHNGFEIVQKNKKLAEEIVYLSRSLGFYTSIREKIAKLKTKKGIYSCKVYKININGFLNKIPTKVERKKAKNSTRKVNPLLTGIKVIKDKIDWYYGFTLDKDGLFLLKDFTITHNTALAYLIINILKKPIYFLKHPRPEIIEKLGYTNLASLEEIERLQDCVIFWDEPQLTTPIYDKKANRIIANVCSLARQLNITLIIASSDTRVFTKHNEAYFDLWLCKDVDYEMVKQGSKIKKAIRNNSKFEPSGFRLEINEFITESRKLREFNGKHTFDLPKKWSEEYSKPYRNDERNSEKVGDNVSEKEKVKKVRKK